MTTPTIEHLISEYREARAADPAGVEEIDRFREFLSRHGGLRKLEPKGIRGQILDRIEALRCFHFSQYFDWFLAEKEGVPPAEIDGARVAISRFNEWLLDRRAIPAEDFEENREAILGSARLASAANPAAGRGDGEGEWDAIAPAIGEEESETGPPGISEERDFYVPGEYSVTRSGEFILTKVQEGILFAKREEDLDDIGPILVDRILSAGSRVGDRVHLSLGRAGDHWNVLTVGRRRSP